MKKLVFIGLMLPMLMLYGQAKLLRQTVRWPAGYDTTGKHWVTYNFYKPVTHWGNENSINSLTQYSAASNFIRWTCDLGNYNGGSSSWVPGDTIIALGSVDSVYIHDPTGYGSRINHCGFYWIYSDTVQPTTPELWAPDDTLRPIPKPIVTKQGLGGLSDDTIVIKIPNPLETRRPDQTQYDVLGYLIYADTTGTGTPNAYNNVSKTKRVLFLVTQGVYGDTTTYKILESNFCPPLIEWPVYFAYKLGAKPDTTVSAADTSGYVTYYFSQNSDSIHVLHNVVGISEGTGDATIQPRLIVSPNPFRNKTDIRWQITDNCSRIKKLQIFNSSGRLVKSFSVTDIGHQSSVIWSGVDNADQAVSAGVYFIEATLDQVKITEKIIVER